MSFFSNKYMKFAISTIEQQKSSSRCMTIAISTQNRILSSQAPSKVGKPTAHISVNKSMDVYITSTIMEA